jgi:hypothetical protein
LDIKACFHYAEFLQAERHFSLFVSSHAALFGKKTKKNSAPHSKFHKVENRLNELMY